MENGDESGFVDYVRSTAPLAAAERQGLTEEMARPPDQPSGNWSRITFRAGRQGLLDLSTQRGAAWSDVLRSLRQRNSPAYVEIDPASSQLTRLLIPKLVTVGDIKPSTQGVEVELIISHAVHLLRNSHPRYQELLNRLTTAKANGQSVAVIDDPSSHNIIDVTVLAERHEAPKPEAAVIEPEAGLEMGPMATVTLAQAQQLFTLMNAKVCCPSRASAACIPFGYPDDGCWGRAHEMYRLMAIQGVTCNKVWIYGNLRAATINNPRCEVRWGWHVAPTLLVNTGRGMETYVIDPSLFAGPVTWATWASMQGDPGARMVASAGAIFYRSSSGSTQTDPSFTETNRVLAQYRDNLRLRSVGADGPPPYTACLPAKTGVQFYGSLAAGATHTWFTYRWPASWHVLWTVVPITTCQGAPQIKWRTRVERADANHATYWISVSNTTNATTRFECRYDILSR